MALVRFTCPKCGKLAQKEAGAINRARNSGAPIYCGRICAGAARRKPPKTEAQRAANKAEYDRSRRNGPERERILKKKKEYHQRTYDPHIAAVIRRVRMPYHVEYCRRPEYVKKKARYDRKYRAAEYGDFAEAYLLAVDLNNEIKTRSTRYEIYQANGTAAKTVRRKRAAARGAVALS